MLDDDADLLAVLEHARCRGERACQCRHPRWQHASSGGAGLDLGMAALPGRPVCPCTLFRLVRGH